jgi:predicted metalloprotease with PDZ domain
MKRLVGLALAATLFLPVGATSAADAPLMRITIKPGAMSEAAGKGVVDVTITVEGMEVPSGEPLLKGSPRRMNGLTLTDAQGPAPLVAPGKGEDDPWRSTRAVKGDAVLHYSLEVNTTDFIPFGPPLAAHIDGDGFSSMGGMLFVLPAAKTPYRIAIDWDTSAMGPGAAGVSTFGDGDVTLAAGPASRLEHTMFMAGHLKRAPAVSEHGFQAVWLGEPDFDPRPAMDWAAKLHHYMSGFFQDRSEPPYRVFLRSNPNNPGGGVALEASFAVGYGPGVTGEGLKNILGHEMTHTWTANDIGKWYDEGDAVYYQTLLPWRAGLISTDQRLADINATAARYYTNPEKDANDNLIEPRFWSDPNLNVLAYDRGALYFAVLDGMIRRESGGKRSVDDLVRAMVERAREGQPLTEAVWVDMLRTELGDAGPALHKSMMVGGGLMLPQSDDYGPCFRRISTKIRVYQKGFTEAKDAQGGAPRSGVTVESVTPDSEAARAGVMAGDVVRYGDSSEGTRRNVTQTLTLHVTRAGKTFDITYLPRGEAVDGYQWERVPGVPESACR